MADAPPTIESEIADLQTKISALTSAHASLAQEVAILSKPATQDPRVDALLAGLKSQLGYE